SDEKDEGIVNGFRHAKNAIKEIVPNEVLPKFKAYFLNQVHIIHYQVPRDIDLNHYFEIMNSRGEQLEKHEIIKARLISKLVSNQDKAIFNYVWEACSEMSVYIQQKYKHEEVFGKQFCDFNLSKFNDLPKVEGELGKQTLNDIINSTENSEIKIEKDKNDTFQPIIDFPNFLLIVLKTKLCDYEQFDPNDFILDDKELINEFDKIKHIIDEEFVKEFALILLKTKYLLDNYIVHQSVEDDERTSNPWKLQKWQFDLENRNYYLKNLDEKSESQLKLQQLLSMFEVSFSPKQRKNYLFYSLLFLNRSNDRKVDDYCEFVSLLAEKYFKDVYLNASKLNQINVPLPNSFDSTLLEKDVENKIWKLKVDVVNHQFDFDSIYGDGTQASKGISSFIFNYLDFKLWEKYAIELKGNNYELGNPVRIDFFESIGSPDFDLNYFDNFYCSRGRNTLEHFYAQANANGEEGKLNQNEINCFGNYALIGGDVNSSASNKNPSAKLGSYKDSGKIKSGVASLKFIIMMEVCIQNEKFRQGQEWIFEDIQLHQKKMVELLKMK
ncbi:MAG: HNH endonuclease, partial [Bacteroidetes bacterium]|nr:HNH endonuclease [Bacteroidota bacterium]